MVNLKPSPCVKKFRQCLDFMCVEPRVELARVLDDINEFFSNRIGRKVLSLK